jgi:hypothetical protein
VQQTFYPLLHTVVTCDLGGPELRCAAQAILGPEGRTFYVSPNAVYVWVQGDAEAAAGQTQGQALPAAAVYRLPLRSGQPGVLRVWGAPTDQFSFKEGEDGYLNVLVRAEGGGDAMWRPEVTEGAVALLRVPLPAFDLGVATVMAGAYTGLPQPTGYELQNRFVGDYVLYGTADAEPQANGQAVWRVYAHPYRRPGGQTASLPLPHGVDRIEAMGQGSVVIGTDGQDLYFSSIALGDVPQPVDRFVQRGASQGETRSHGFFYRPDDAENGVLGLPWSGPGRSDSDSIGEGSAAVIYLRVRSLRLSELGSLFSRDEGLPDDQCVASCADWYGNARPIFYRGRVFALLGYELVEGRIENERVVEIGRANMFGSLGRALQ